MISNLGPFVDALPRINPPFSKAVHVWRKADKGMRTDEAQIGHWGLHRDPSMVNISSQSIHRNISLSFMMSSADPCRTLNSFATVSLKIEQAALYLAAWLSPGEDSRESIRDPSLSVPPSRMVWLVQMIPYVILSITLCQ